MIEAKSFPKGSAVKNLSAMQETHEMWVPTLSQEDPLEEGMEAHSRILPKESYGKQSLACHSPQGHKQSDMTEVI